MKKLLLSITFVSCALFSHAQGDKTFILSNSQPIGENLKNGTPIQGTGYIFESPISDININTLNNTATILLVHTPKYITKGILLDYDFNNNTIRWEKTMNLNKEKIRMTPGLTIVKNNKESYTLNPTDGVPSWKTDADFFYTDIKSNIGIGFPQKKFTVSNKLQGINLATGKEIWERKIDHHLGINSVTPVNDTLILIVADKIYAVNTQTGTGWEYAVNTGTTIIPESPKLLINDKYSEDSDYNFLPDGRTICGLVSTPIIKDSKIYIASEDFVTCLSESGKVEWKTPLSSALTSRTRIFTQNGQLYVINTGYSYFDGKKIQYGVAFVAAFDLKDGQQTYLTKIDRGFIADYQAVGNTLYLLFPINKLVEINLTTGEIAQKITLESIDHSEAMAFPHTNFYMQEGGDYKKLIFGNNEIYFINDQKKLVEYNQTDKTSSIVNPDKLFRETFQVDGLTCISQNKNSIILSGGQAIAKLQVGANSFISANQIFYITDNILYRVDINTITGK